MLCLDAARRDVRLEAALVLAADDAEEALVTPSLIIDMCAIGGLGKYMQNRSSSTAR